ncbi:hypothetical protein [Amycolatopsis sp. NPDC050768]|uniref:hypothetical protein n=1 Tax=Amycolatopsis sp. NPDC050768 TaxID=3154839 RepID=UPI003406CFA8
MTDLFPRTTATFVVTTTTRKSAAGGDLDCAVAERLSGLPADELALRPSVLIVDLTRVTFCGTRVLHLLLTAAADAHAAGIPCVSSGMSFPDSPRRIAGSVRLFHAFCRIRSRRRTHSGNTPVTPPG